MDGIGMKRRFIALAAAYALLLQMFLPFAALASTPGGPGSVICSSTTPSDSPGGQHECSCAAGCGLCAWHMPGILPGIATASVQPQTPFYDVDPWIDFQVATIRFSPQAARPPPLG
jgi:hypothetical protein